MFWPFPKVHMIPFLRRFLISGIFLETMLVLLRWRKFVLFLRCFDIINWNHILLGCVRLFKPCFARKAALTSFIFLIPDPPYILVYKFYHKQSCVENLLSFIFMSLLLSQKKVHVCTIYFFAHIFRIFGSVHRVLTDTCKVLFGKNDSTDVWSRFVCLTSLPSCLFRPILSLISLKFVLLLFLPNSSSLDRC